MAEQVSERAIHSLDAQFDKDRYAREMCNANTFEQLSAEQKREVANKLNVDETRAFKESLGIPLPPGTRAALAMSEADKALAHKGSGNKPAWRPAETFDPYLTEEGREAATR